MALLESLMSDQRTASENPLSNFIPALSKPKRDDVLSPLQRVFPNGLEYARAALRWFAERGEKIHAGIEDQVFWLTAPNDLKQRLNYLPREVRPDDDHFKLTPDKDAISAEIRRTRQEEDSKWPALHYLWPIHPVMEWLSDRALNAFGRHTAPVLRLPGKLGADEHFILIHGGFPNRRGHVLIQDWIGVHLKGGKVIGDMDWPTLQKTFDLYPGKLPNRNISADTTALQALLPQAVDAARLRLKGLKESFEAARRSTLQQQQQRLAQLKAKHESQLELELGRSAQHESIKARTREDRQRHIDRVFSDYQSWLDNTQTTEDQPYLQVAAVLTGQEG
jgi:hypothetical protein